jgi:hypothetical protein
VSRIIRRSRPAAGGIDRTARAVVMEICGWGLIRENLSGVCADGAVPHRTRIDCRGRCDCRDRWVPGECWLRTARPHRIPDDFRKRLYAPAKRHGAKNAPGDETRRWEHRGDRIWARKRGSRFLSDMAGKGRFTVPASP